MIVAVFEKLSNYTLSMQGIDYTEDTDPSAEGKADTGLKA